MKQQVTLIEKKEVAKDTVSFYFTKPEAFQYKAGQSIDLFLINPPETDEEGNKRAFSLASAPFEEHIMITTRMRDTAFKRVLKNLPLNTALQVDGPFGSFTLHNDIQKTAVFLTGGIGITPMRSMIQQAIHDNTGHQLILFYSNHNPAETAFFNEFSELQTAHKNFIFVPTMTQMDEGTWNGKRERISKEMLAEYITDLQKAIFYSCGPSGMVWMLTETLLSAGVNEDSIRKEDFSGY